MALPRYFCASRYSSSQAIWIASSLPSFDAFGSSAKSSSSVTHRCRSVKRTLKGSTSGNFSCSAIPISSESSQVSFILFLHFPAHQYLLDDPVHRQLGELPRRLVQRVDLTADGSVIL